MRPDELSLFDFDAGQEGTREGGARHIVILSQIKLAAQAVRIRQKHESELPLGNFNN